MLTTTNAYEQTVKIYSCFAFLRSVPMSCWSSSRMVGFDWISSRFVKVVTVSFGKMHLSPAYNFSWTKGETTRACRISEAGAAAAVSSCYNYQNVRYEPAKKQEIKMKTSKYWFDNFQIHFWSISSRLH